MLRICDRRAGTANVSLADSGVQRQHSAEHCRWQDARQYLQQMRARVDHFDSRQTSILTRLRADALNGSGTNYVPERSFARITLASLHDRNKYSGAMQLTPVTNAARRKASSSQLEHTMPGTASIWQASAAVARSTGECRAIPRGRSFYTCTLCEDRLSVSRLSCGVNRCAAPTLAPKLKAQRPGCTGHGFKRARARAA